jgi:hypothetical protein
MGALRDVDNTTSAGPEAPPPSRQTGVRAHEARIPPPERALHTARCAAGADPGELHVSADGNVRPLDRSGMFVS